jgi:hypothetical protein
VLALQWVGKLLVSPVSQPFFLGSPEHERTMQGLPEPLYAEPEVLDLTVVQPWLTSAGQSKELSAWCVHGGLFRKLVRGDARSGAGFAGMAAAYALLAELLPSAPLQLRLPSSVRLLYGLHELLVEMPAVAGARPALEEELKGAVLASLARSIAWLAARRLVYTDLRGPNVLLQEPTGEPWLVDFDDAAVAAEPVLSLAGYKRVLGSSPQAGAQQQHTFAARLAAGEEGAFEAALEQAFEELAQAQPAA